ncbi:hypothetical protein MOE20_13170 [Bacillus atrophaeus]|uniref:hypothetical protein n=1 Tax=Bacillus atrophaeus TaxID=1452 RepID=UPI00227DBE06|nr:hypothetical protein [Bacillus atrophaeus]MCY8925559.1 hypothetical protein [Bacillus atrophaeus]
MTMNNKNGTIKIKRKEALQYQLPPESSIALFKTKVTAKKSEANIPTNIPHFGMIFFILYYPQILIAISCQKVIVF